MGKQPTSEDFGRAFLNSAARQGEGAGCPLVACLVMVLIAALALVVLR